MLILGGKLNTLRVDLYRLYHCINENTCAHEGNRENKNTVKKSFNIKRTGFIIRIFMAVGETMTANNCRCKGNKQTDSIYFDIIYKIKKIH